MVKSKNINNCSGFTLIELAISTIIVGILFAAVAYPYSVWIEKKNHEQTAKNVEQMAWVVSAFKITNGYYPCPAPIDSDRAAPSYGRQTDCSISTIPTGTCSAAGGKYCVAQSASPTDMIVFDKTASPVVPEQITPRVRIGTIPFRELNMPEEFAYDAYGNRILYAVTENLAYDNIYNHEDAGGIDIVYEGGASRLDKPDRGNFVVLSHGKDGMGGVNRFGVANGSLCNESSPDGQNCDFMDGVGVNAQFFVSELATTNDNNQHDDTVIYQIPLNTPLWARSSTNTSDIYSIPTKDNPDGRVGSDYLYNYYAKYPERTDNPAYLPVGDAAADAAFALAVQDYTNVYENARLWIGGNIRVEQQAQANNICDREGQNCFKADAIGGPVGVSCPTGFLMKGVHREDGGTPTDISDDTIVGECEEQTSFSCPAGTFMKGLVDGEPRCVRQPCASITVTVCSETFVLPLSDDQTVIFHRAGDSYRCGEGTFTCNNGTWDQALDEGWCVCTPTTTPLHEDCDPGCTGAGLDYFEVQDCDTCSWRWPWAGPRDCTCPPPPPPGPGIPSPPPPAPPGVPPPPSIGDPSCKVGMGPLCTGA